MRRSLVISAYFLGLIFIFSGCDKLYHYDGFLNALNSYVLLPQGMGRLIATPLIVVEVCTGVGLLVASWRRIAAVLSAVLLGLFTVALAVNQFFQPGSICGCWFTLTLAQGTKAHILQNVVMLGLAITIWYELREDKSLEKTAVGTLDGRLLG